MEKEMKKGFKKVVATERTVFNDEEQRRYVPACAPFTYFNLKWLCCGNPFSFSS